MKECEGERRGRGDHSLGNGCSELNQISINQCLERKLSVLTEQFIFFFFFNMKKSNKQYNKAGKF